MMETNNNISCKCHTVAKQVVKSTPTDLAEDASTRILCTKSMDGLVQILMHKIQIFHE